MKEGPEGIEGCIKSSKGTILAMFFPFRINLNKIY